MTTTAITPMKGESAARTRGRDAHAEPLMLRRRIGSTTFLVTVHFSGANAETPENKVLRLIEREVGKAA